MDSQKIRQLVDNLDRLQEGSIGAKIGGFLGGLVGAKDAGSQLGSDIGDAIGHVFNPETKANQPVQQVSSSSSSGAKYITTNPDGSTSDVKPPPGGWDADDSGSKYDDKIKDFRDKYGNTAKDYVAQPNTVAISASYGGQTASSKLQGELQRIATARGTGEKEVKSWTWHNSVLCLLEADRSRQDTALGTTTGVWSDITRLATMGGGDQFVGLYKRLGYTDFMGDNVFVQQGPLGNLFGERHEMRREGAEIVIVNLSQFFAFQSSQGKGLHLYCVSYIGPREDWTQGGKAQLDALSASVSLSGNVKPLSPPSAKESMQSLKQLIVQLEQQS